MSKDVKHIAENEAKSNDNTESLHIEGVNGLTEIQDNRPSTLQLQKLQSSTNNSLRQLQFSRIQSSVNSPVQRVINIPGATLEKIKRDIKYHVEDYEKLKEKYEFHIDRLQEDSKTHAASTLKSFGAVLEKYVEEETEDIEGFDGVYETLDEVSKSEINVTVRHYMPDFSLDEEERITNEYEDLIENNTYLFENIASFATSHGKLKKWDSAFKNWLQALKKTKSSSGDNLLEQFASIVEIDKSGIIQQVEGAPTDTISAESIAKYVDDEPINLKKEEKIQLYQRDKNFVGELKELKSDTFIQNFQKITTYLKDQNSFNLEGCKAYLKIHNKFPQLLERYRTKKTKFSEIRHFPFQDVPLINDGNIEPFEKEYEALFGDLGAFLKSLKIFLSTKSALPKSADYKSHLVNQLDSAVYSQQNLQYWLNDMAILISKESYKIKEFKGLVWSISDKNNTVTYEKAYEINNSKGGLKGKFVVHVHPTTNKSSDYRHIKFRSGSPSDSNVHWPNVPSVIASQLDDSKDWADGWYEDLRNTLKEDKNKVKYEADLQLY